MTIEYSRVLSEFEYDTQNEYWVRLADGKAFFLIEKDENDMAKIAEVAAD
jgi:hypothetical protein